MIAFDHEATMESIRKDAARVLEARYRPMEEACRMVMQLGYTPADCLIKTHRPTAHVYGQGWKERDVLVVRGVPAFEVETTCNQVLDEGRIEFHHKCHVRTWPPAIHTSAPVPAPTSVGGEEA